MASRVGGIEKGSSSPGRPLRQARVRDPDEATSQYHQPISPHPEERSKSASRRMHDVHAVSYAIALPEGRGCECNRAALKENWGSCARSAANMALGGAKPRISVRRRAGFGIACFAAAAISCLVPGASRAATDGREPSSDHRLDELIDRWRCPVAAYIDKVHRRSQKLDHRYLALWAKHRPDFYVQCIFHDGDRQIFCEAASGFYRYADRIGSFATAQRLDALAGLGFSTDGSRGNFSQDRDFRGAEEAAPLMIETLARVFELDIGDVLEFSAPLVTKRKAKPRQIRYRLPADDRAKPEAGRG